MRPQDLPADVDPGGLEVDVGYKPQRDSGTFSYAAHAAVVAVDPDIGEVEILDYVIVEDGGVLVNPMVVDGQIYGGLAQGIGTALYEEMPFDALRPAARDDASPTICCPGRPRVPAAASRSHGDAVALHAVRREGHRRGRRHRAAGRDRQCGQRRAAAARRRIDAVADHAAPHRRGGARGRATQRGRRHESRRRSATERPRDLQAALPLLVEAARSAKIIAGGQSLGPMLNLRLVRAADLIVDIGVSAELEAG